MRDKSRPNRYLEIAFCLAWSHTTWSSRNKEYWWETSGAYTSQSFYNQNTHHCIWGTVILLLTLHILFPLPKTLFSSLPYWLIPTCPSSLNSRTPVLQSFPDLPQRIRYLSSDCLHCGHVVLCTSLLWFTGVLEPFMYISSQFHIQWYHTGILKLSFWLLESGAFNFSNAPLPITMVFFTFFSFSMTPSSKSELLKDWDWILLIFIFYSSLYIVDEGCFLNWCETEWILYPWRKSLFCNYF